MLPHSKNPWSPSLITVAEEKEFYGMSEMINACVTAADADSPSSSEEDSGSNASAENSSLENSKFAKIIMKAFIPNAAEIP